jgi:hypothetical protein
LNRSIRPAAISARSDIDCASPAFDRESSIFSLIVLGAAAALGVYAAIELRPLFADGFNYLLYLVQWQTFIAEGSRITVELIRQSPALLAIRLSVTDLHGYAVIFGLSLQIAPILLLIAAWFALPAGRKYLFVFPLLHLVAGTLSSSYAAITEGATAAAYFWLLFFLVLFGRRRWPVAALIVLAAGASYLHESMSFLGLILALAAAWRAKQAPVRRERWFFAALAVWFVAVALLQAYFVLVPFHPDNRASFFQGLLRWDWLRGTRHDPNLPAVFGLISLPVGVLLLLLRWAWPGRPAERLGAILIVGFGAYVVYRLVEAVWGQLFFVAEAQFAARNNGAILSAPIAVVAFAFVLWPRMATATLLRQWFAVCLVMAVGGTVWHVATMRAWDDYLATFRQVLAGKPGYISFADAVASLPPEKKRLMRAFGHGWLEPTMSIALAPKGDIGVVIGASNPPGWQPFDPLRTRRLPRSPYWHWDRYLRALAAQKSEEPRPTP